VLRQFFYSAFQFYQYTQLMQSGDEQLAGIAEKSLKEVTYHLRWSSEWVIRLGDGTEESNRRINLALAELWMFTGEAFEPAAYELVDTSLLKKAWTEKVTEIFSEATLELPKPITWHQRGGKEGKHTEHLGYLLAEMQYLQRTYPNATW
jgi:ring-1,2-phenylacetyl-CoA epoxidase subunit PaaC